MTDYLTTDTELTSVADAIRTKGGTSSSLTYPAGFVSAVNAIPTGITPTGTLNITENGTYNVTNYASASVNVSGSGGGLQTCTLTLADGSVTCSGFSDHTPAEPYLAIARYVDAPYQSPLIYYSGIGGRGQALLMGDASYPDSWFGVVMSPGGYAELVDDQVSDGSGDSGYFEAFENEWSAVVYEL